MKLKILSILLVCLGLLQSFGHVTGLKLFKQLGQVSVASPLPIVFTQKKDFLETFALEYTLMYVTDSNQTKSIQITPELYAKIDKPYNYRNVLGAVIAYGPMLSKELVSSVLNYAFIKPAVMSQAFKLEPFNKAQIQLKSKTKNVDKIYYLPIGVLHD